MVQEDTLYGRICIAGMPVRGPIAPYEGDYHVTPGIAAQTLPTRNTHMLDNLEIKAIPYYEVSNISGKTVIIGG